jgi:hypothetical protein
MSEKQLWEMVEQNLNHRIKQGTLTGKLKHDTKEIAEQLKGAQETGGNCVVMAYHNASNMGDDGCLIKFNVNPNPLSTIIGDDDPDADIIHWVAYNKKTDKVVDTSCKRNIEWSLDRYMTTCYPPIKSHSFVELSSVQKYRASIIKKHKIVFNRRFNKCADIMSLLMLHTIAQCQAEGAMHEIPHMTGVYINNIKKFTSGRYGDHNYIYKSLLESKYHS